jgi:opacity protein-like surface antigen
MAPISKAVIVPVALLVWSSTALGAERSPYVQIGAGANFMDRLKLESPAGVESRSQLNFDPGPLVTGSVGYAFANNFRAEFEVGYRDAPGKDITLPGGGTVSPANFKAGSEIYTYMANGFYDFGPFYSSWYPHVGFGVGAANVNSHRANSETVFAYQAIGGLEYQLQPRLRLGLDYRYLGTDTVHLGLTQAGSRGVSGSVNDHAILFTLRWNFFN